MDVSRYLSNKVETVTTILRPGVGLVSSLVGHFTKELKIGGSSKVMCLFCFNILIISSLKQKNSFRKHLLFPLENDIHFQGLKRLCIIME